MFLLSLHSSGKDVYLFLVPSEGCHWLSDVGWERDDSTFLSSRCLSTQYWLPLPATTGAAVGGAWDVLSAERLMCLDAHRKFKISQ